MPRLKVGRGIAGDLDLAVGVLPNQDLHWKIDRDAGRRDHERRSGFRIAEDQQLGGTHLHPCPLRLTAMIDHAEQFDPLGLQDPRKFLNRLVDRVLAEYGYDAVL